LSGVLRLGTPLCVFEEVAECTMMLDRRKNSLHLVSHLQSLRDMLTVRLCAEVHPSSAPCDLGSISSLRLIASRTLIINSVDDPAVSSGNIDF
jgi:hypothetical protein